MFQELLGKQVRCSDGKKLVPMAMDCLAIMYPLFSVVTSDFDIHPNEPFIYVGDIKWANKIRKYQEPHIIGAATGEYDLTDRKTLIQLAYLKHNKTVPKYLEEIDLDKDWDYDTFMMNWKYIWLMGAPLDKVKEQNDVFYKLIDKLSKPVELIEVFSDALDTYGEESFKYLENAMVSFIYKCKDMNATNTKSRHMLEIRSKFIASYSKNIHNAVWNLIHSNIDYQPLRFLNFLLDLTWPERGKILNDRR